MSPRGYYGFERRRREDARRARQQAKLRRRSEGGEAEPGAEIGEPQDTGAPADRWEWFSPSRNRVTTSAPGTRPAEESPDDWILLTDVSDDERPPAGA